jgi:hypothetical protein
MATTKLHFVFPYRSNFQPRHNPNFQHRHNSNGTCDSICLRCYRTIATTRYEDWLAHEESNHACSLLDKHIWMSDRIDYRI